MLQADALTILGRLKDAYPPMSLDEGQSEVLLKELTLLHDPSVLDEAVTNIIRQEEKFPPIARIRSAYRAVNNSRSAQRAAIEASQPTAGDHEIPEWVLVWSWQRARTEGARQAANTTTRGPMEKRPPVRMRQFPQEENDPTVGTYSWDEYERIKTGWVAAGSPRVGSAAEVLMVAAGVLTTGTTP